MAVCSGWSADGSTPRVYPLYHQTWWTTRDGRPFLDCELSLPQAWTTDAAQCAAAGVPGEVRFATKPHLVRQMLARVLAAGVPWGWVTGD
jgi:SRSO17 transposase